MASFPSTTVSTVPQILLLSLLIASASVAATQHGRPNILFIFTDDQTQRSVSAYRDHGAHPWVHTPHIDRLAKRGVLFSHAYIGTWCMPSRATILTGHLPHAIESLRMKLPYPKAVYDPDQAPFWPSIFRQHGYVTAQIGKWHLARDAGFGRDWDHQRVWNRSRYTFNASRYYRDQFISTDGGLPLPVTGYSTDNYTRWAAEFIDDHAAPDSPPWFLWLCYDAPHAPFFPAQRHLDAYEGARVPIPTDIYEPPPGKPSYLSQAGVWKSNQYGQPYLPVFKSINIRNRGIHGPYLDDWTRQYHQTMLSVDEGVGLLIDALEKSGQLDDTLIVFTSDQGYAIGQHGFFTKLAPYDANLRAPLILSFPKTLPEGRICTHPVGGVDLIPTFFSMAGIPLPWFMHGHDLTPLLQNPGRSNWPHPVLLTMTKNRFGSDTAEIPRRTKKQTAKGVPWWVSLTKDQYKYIRVLVEGEVEELYDLVNDPEELHNLAIDPAYRPILGSMRQGTIRELERTESPFVDRMPKPSTF